MNPNKNGYKNYEQSLSNKSRQMSVIGQQKSVKESAYSQKDVKINYKSEGPITLEKQASDNK